MLEILIGHDYDSDQDILVSSDEVIAVVWPCSHFESMVLWRKLQEVWNVPRNQIVTPTIVRSYLVDWVHFLGEPKEIAVTLELWYVYGQPVVFVDSFGDMFSYNLVEQWLDGHFVCTYDRGTRRAFFDPMNFHNCMRAIQEAAGIELKPKSR